MNNLTVSGRLGRDPEIRTIGNGNSIVNASIAVNEGYFKKDSNEWVDQGFWVDFTVWGDQAVRFAERYKKGDNIAITGKLSEEKWDDKTTGEKRKKIVIKPFQFEKLGSGKGGQDSDGGGEDDADADAKYVEGPNGTNKLDF